MNFIAGMNWNDLQAAAPIDQVLGEARDQQLTEIAIVGRNAAGEIIVMASHPNADAVIGLLTRGIGWLSCREQLQSQEIE